MHEAAYGVVPHVFHSGLGLHLRHVPGLPPKEAKKAFKSFTRKAQVAKAPLQLAPVQLARIKPSFMQKHLPKKPPALFPQDSLPLMSLPAKPSKAKRLFPKVKPIHPKPLPSPKPPSSSAAPFSPLKSFSSKRHLLEMKETRRLHSLLPSLTVDFHTVPTPQWFKMDRPAGKTMKSQPLAECAMEPMVCNL